MHTQRVRGGDAARGARSSNDTKKSVVLFIRRCGLQYENASTYKRVRVRSGRAVTAVTAGLERSPGYYFELGIGGTDGYLKVLCRFETKYSCRSRARTTTEIHRRSGSFAHG